MCLRREKDGSAFHAPAARYGLEAALRAFRVALTPSPALEMRPAGPEGAQGREGARRPIPLRGK